MGRADYFLEGSYNFRCQECFKKCKAVDAYRRWDNLWVCERCWEIRNPQDYQRGIPDKQTPPWTTGDSPPIFVQNVQPSTSMYPMVLNGWLLNGRTLG